MDSEQPQSAGNLEPNKQAQAPWAEVGDVYLQHLPADKSEGERFRLPTTDTVLGCSSSRLLASDPYVAPKHMRIYRQDDGLWVSDVESLCGVFACVDEHVLAAGDILRIGRQLLRYEPDAGGKRGYLALLAGHGDDGFALKRGTTVFGRSKGDVRFETDRSISNPHAKIELRAEGYTLVDLESENGVYLRLTAPRQLFDGDTVLIGQCRFRVNILPKAA